MSIEELNNLQEEYLAGSEEQKKFLEQRFGKQVIQRAIEESFSMKWMEENSKNCPRCGCHIQVSSTDGTLHRKQSANLFRYVNTQSRVCVRLSHDVLAR